MPQLSVVGLFVLQVPEPLQRRLNVWTPFEHDSATQTVLDGQYAHEPVPLHDPVKPQVEDDDAAHSLSGSWPLGMFEQVPSDPASLHDWHEPPHDELQQYPSTQLPLEH